MTKLDYPATGRNREFIAKEMTRILPPQGWVLEIASGSGQHCVYLAEIFPRLIWQPSDPEPEARASIAAWTADSGLDNILPPLAIDCTRADHPAVEADVIWCANMIHIAPWEAAIGLLALAGTTLTSSQPLILYGPYWIDGRDREPSNLAFDDSLRSRNAAWGIRELSQVESAASEQGLALQSVVDMPANNVLIVFRKT